MKRKQIQSKQDQKNKTGNAYDGECVGGRCDVFFFIGIKSFMELKTLSNAADREEKQFEEICHWFLDTYTAETINADAGISDDSDEQNYFLRYEVMRSLLLEKYPKTDASLLDHIIETIYDKIFLA